MAKIQKTTKIGQKLFLLENKPFVLKKCLGDITFLTAKKFFLFFEVSMKNLFFKIVRREENNNKEEKIFQML